MMQVTVPDGVVGGQVIAVATPTGQMQTTVPPGLKAGDQFQLQMPVVAAVAMPIGAEEGTMMGQPVYAANAAMPVAAMPVAAQPMGYTGNLPDAVGRGKWPKIKNWDAEAYCRSLPDEQTRAANYAGCRVIRAADGSGTPCGAAYGCNPCGECLWFPFLCLCGIPIPLPIVCSSERMDNQWITRGKHGEKTGAWVIIDAENKHLASYGVKCCSQQLEEHPQCYCEKV